MKLQVESLYVGCACAHEETGFKLDAGLLTRIEKMLRKLWKDKGIDEGIDTDVAKGFFEQLYAAVKEGFNLGEVAIDYDTPNGKMLDSLRRDVSQFSAAKNYQQLQELQGALIDGDGKVRSWSNFKRAAYEINDRQVNRWLRTEYDTAIASGQMAGKWVEIEENKDVLPLLQYDAVLDGRTSDICADFADVILPVDDSFWDRFYPPNHFGCRSSVRQLSEGTISDSKNIPVSDKIPDMFKVNLGKQGLAFPPDHPYYVGVPENVLNARF